jgi:pantothenate kinase type III
MNSGCYYGLLGSVERIIAEIRLESPTPFEIMTIATGTVTEKLSWKTL